MLSSAIRNAVRLQTALVIVVTAALPASAPAQAWVPPDGEGTVSLTYQGLFSDTHLDRQGRPINPARIDGHTILLGLDFGVTDRLGVDARVAWVANRYQGADLLHGPLDTGIFHGAMQDARVAVRYRLRPDAPLAITPFVSVILPTHNYQTRGHSAPGRHLRTLQLGLSAGRNFALASADLYAQGQYAYAFVERVEGMHIDRSTVDLEVGYAVAPRLTLVAAGALQRTHGGLEFPLPRDEHYHERVVFHDRVGKADILLFSSGVTLAVGDLAELYAMGVWTVSGRNTHAVKGLSVGVAWTFGSRVSLAQRDTAAIAMDAVGRLRR